MRRRLAVPTVLLLSGLALALAGAGSAPDNAAVNRLVRDSGGTARVSAHPATGATRFLRLPPGRLALDGANETERARDFLYRYGNAFGIKNADLELTAPVTAKGGRGHTRLSYAQVYRGVPVFAGRLHVHFDPQGRLAAANGTFVPEISIDTKPNWKREAAEAVAIADVRKRVETPPVAPLEARSSKLMVFRSGLVQRVPGQDHLVYEVEVGDGVGVREFVYVDAHDGRIVDRITGIHTALTRKVHEPSFNNVVIWNDGDALPYDSGDALNDEQVNGLIDTAEDVYDLYANLSGGSYLSWNGQDDTMHTIWNASFISCPNATWNGLSANFCDGVASDDVAAHEWSHGFTQATHGLIYQWQPGALNEAYSDIFGELIDMLNGLGTDVPNVTRMEGDCSIYGSTPPPSLVIDDPLEIAGTYPATGGAFNPAPPVTVTAQVEMVDDADNEGGSASVTDGCQPLVGFTSGNIALIDRGTCAFVTKVLNAQNAGAVGVIIANDQAGISTMGGDDPSITIPSVMISQADGTRIKFELANGVNATISLVEATADSYRWMMGEDSFAFSSGPIRDMWTPTCKGDPGKVSDIQYWCGPEDGGGVHTNSGVPNHAFALLVDGGTYNGRTVGALGETKAAHLYWRAMSVYQVPDTDFADHADALSQSCSDLLGVDLADLLTGSPSGEVLTTDDCTQVDEAMLAVEMTADPPCNFVPVLDPDTPPLTCGTAAFYDDFEQDPTGTWGRGNEGVYADYTPRDWEWTSDVPNGGTGSAFFALDSRTLGECTEGPNDQSGKMYLDSPVLSLASDGSVVFDHWVATEPRFDGGNVKVSVNGGSFQLVAGSAFVFNPYNDVLVEPPNNTNPIAGEPAFAGSDGGAVAGSWGQSRIDLSAYAAPGDTIQLRFEFGVDGCNGLIGWYVDNVLVCASEVSAGQIPSGGDLSGTPLTITKAVAPEITLNWAPSCHVADGDYEIYEGTIGDFANRDAKFCSTDGATTKTFEPGAGNVYYLVVPRNQDREGSYGTNSAGDQRLPAAGACLVQAISDTCP